MSSTNYASEINLKYLYLDSISANKSVPPGRFPVLSTAQLMQQGDHVNWVPIIVQEVAHNEFKVIGNHLTYAVAQSLQLERVWCLVISHTDPAVFEVISALSGESVPKICLSIAKYAEIKAAIDYLAHKPDQPLKAKGLTPLKITETLHESKARKYLPNFSAVAKLLGVTASSKVTKALQTVFYLEPQELPKPPSICISTASQAEITAGIKFLVEHPDNALAKIDTNQLIASIVAAEDRPYWPSLSPISKLGCGVSASNPPMKALKTVFDVSAIAKLNLTKLKKLAKDKGLEISTDASKNDLIDLLQQSSD